MKIVSLTVERWDSDKIAYVPNTTYVNLDHFQYFYQIPGNDKTAIVMVNNECLLVEETPQEICDILVTYGLVHKLS